MTDNEKRGTEQRVAVEYLEEQRALGWPDVHPEDYCHQCGNRNVSWWTDSDVWNAVMDSATAPFHGILCPSCFGKRFEERYPATSWELRLSADTRGARAFLAEHPAHTPTNDEREALLREADALVASWDQRGSWSSDSPVGMVMRLAAALRRSEIPAQREAIRALDEIRALLDQATDERGVTWWSWIEDGLGGTLHDDLRAILNRAAYEVPEPSAETEDEIDPEECKACGELNTECRCELDYEACCGSPSGRHFTHCPTYRPEPQGEPSDAQVLAARKVWLSVRITKGDHYEAMRAALRAAGGVR